MLNNNQTTNIGFKSTSGIMIKTHPDSEITWCHWGSPFYKGLDKKMILQMMLISDEMMCVEYVKSLGAIEGIFGNEENGDRE